MNTPAASGTIFNIQSFSIHDGPGIRTTLFLKGCPLHCPWCSNPESMDPAIQVRTSPEKCIGCGTCADLCPTGALSKDNGHVHFDHARCDDCLACVDACPNGCITGIGTVIRVDDAVQRLIKDRAFYENTGGGVTLSGGEPLYQYAFASEVLRRLHERGVHTALDTSGFASWDAFQEVMPHVDLVLFDIKHLDRDMHRRVIGVDNALILENLGKLAGRTRIWTRTPLIPDFNDDVEVTDAIVDLAVRVGAERCCFLPLHRWGEHKYGRLGLNNPHARFRDVLPAEAAVWKERYRHREGFVFFEKA